MRTAHPRPVPPEGSGGPGDRDPAAPGPEVRASRLRRSGAGADVTSANRGGPSARQRAPRCSRCAVPLPVPDPALRTDGRPGQQELPNCWGCWSKVQQPRCFTSVASCRGVRCARTSSDCLNCSIFIS